MEKLLNDILNKNLNLQLKDKTSSKTDLKFSLEKGQSEQYQKHNNSNQTIKTSVQIDDEVKRKRDIIINTKEHFIKLLRII